MKRFLKISAIVLGILIVLFLSALKLVPIFAKNYIVSHSEDLIGRALAIESLRLNPFTFTLEIEKFTLFEQDKKTPFIAFDELRTNINPLQLISKTASVEEIYLNGFYAKIIQDGERFNFSDILEFFNKPTAQDSLVDGNISTKETLDTLKNNAASLENSGKISVDLKEIVAQIPLKLDIKNIYFGAKQIIYEDKKRSAQIEVDDLNVQVPAVNLYDKITEIFVQFKFLQGGTFKTKIAIAVLKNDFKVQMNLDELGVQIAKPYLKDFIRFNDFAGTFTMEIFAEGSSLDVLNTKVSGAVELDSITLTEVSGQKLGVKKIAVALEEVRLAENKFFVASVMIDGAFAHIDLLKNGSTNIDVLLNPKRDISNDSTENKDTLAVENEVQKTENEPQLKESPEQKLNAKINKFIVKNTTASATDHSLKKPFNYKVSGISVRGANINLNAPCTINVNANLPEGGNASIKYEGSLANLGTMKAYVSVKNVHLKHFSPYSEHFTAYPLIVGTLAFASDNVLSHFDIDSKNTIDIYNIDVGDKIDAIDPEFTVPMKVGLYILKDKDEKIQFDIPVKGNLKDPEFSFGKIIWKTVMNLLIKVAVSPLKIVGNLAQSGANAVGLDLGKNDEIYISATRSSFSSEEYAKAIKMVEAIQKDANLKLTFTQHLNLRKIIPEYRIQKLKTEFYKIKEQKNTLNEIDEKAIEELDTSDENYKTFAEENAPLLTDKILRKELLELAEKRNQELLKILKQQKGVTAKQIKVETSKTLNSHRGKPLYKITLDLQ